MNRTLLFVTFAFAVLVAPRADAGVPDYSGSWKGTDGPDLGARWQLKQRGVKVWGTRTSSSGTTKNVLGVVESGGGIRLVLRPALKYAPQGETEYYMAGLKKAPVRLVGSKNIGGYLHSWTLTRSGPLGKAVLRFEEPGGPPTDSLLALLEFGADNQPFLESGAQPHHLIRGAGHTLRVHGTYVAKHLFIVVNGDTLKYFPGDSMYGVRYEEDLSEALRPGENVVEVVMGQTSKINYVYVVSDAGTLFEPGKPIEKLEQELRPKTKAQRARILFYYLP